MTIVDEIEAKKERLLLDALRAELRSINVNFFYGALQAPVLELDDSTARLAAWDPRSCTITVSRSFLRQAPWVAVREVLKHESAHQYVSEVLRITDESAHGESFRKVCARQGIDPRAAGAFVDGAVADHDADIERVLRRVDKLLALARSDNENEAQAAADAAQRLMLEHNLAAQSRPRRYIVRVLGSPVTRMHAHEKILGGILSAYFFVNVVIGRAWHPEAARMGKILEVTGTPENIEMATWIHAFLLGAGERCFQDVQRQRGLPQKQRLPFLTGFMTGVSEKLRRERAAQQERGLVWVGDADLARFVELRYPRLGRGRYFGSFGEGHAAGREAGNEIVIAKPIDGEVGDRGRALPPARS